MVYNFNVKPRKSLNYLCYSMQYKYSTKPKMKFLHHENYVSEMQLLLLKIGKKIKFLAILYWEHCIWYWLRHSVYKTRICLKVEWMKSQTFNFKAEPDHLSFWVHSSLMYSKFFTCLEATHIHTEYRQLRCCHSI